MAQKKSPENEPEILQIRVHDTKAALDFKVYALTHKLSHGTLLVKSFRALQAQEAAEQKK